MAKEEKTNDYKLGVAAAWIEAAEYIMTKAIDEFKHSENRITDNLATNLRILSTEFKEIGEKKEDETD